MSTATHPDVAGSGDVPAGTTVGVDPLAADIAASLPLPGGDAAARLASSRERLRQAMTPPVVEPKPRLAAPSFAGSASPREAAPVLPQAVTDVLRRLFARARAVPAVEVVVDAAEVWWAGHPLHTAGLVAADASKSYMQPIARKNPIALVAGSAVVGALFFLTRPWRWALRPILLAGLLPQIVSQALRRAPVGTILNIATAYAKRRPSASPRRPAAPSTVRPASPAGPGSATTPSVSPARRSA